MKQIVCLRFLALAALSALPLASPYAVMAAEELPVLEERAMKDAVERIAPSVVRIETVGGLERVGEFLVGTGATTGLIVSEDGYIISSAFNFAQKPDSILVSLADGTRLAAQLVATDHNRRLVLLKIKTETALPVPDFVPRNDIRPGQWSIAVGRTFEGGQPNISTGIVSAVNRIWGKMIQTDAKISPNNYGGPLVDISGRVLGVLVPVSPEGNSETAGIDWYDSGIGFAVPLEDVQQVLPKLKEGQDVHPGILGIVMPADQFSKPAEITVCRANSPAHKAGLKPGDRIVEAAGKKVTRQAELKHQLGGLNAGDKIKLVVLRGKERIEREVELVAKLPAYEYPFLGILPTRPVDGKPAGLVVRYVYPEGPAAKAGLKEGDQITNFGGEAIEDVKSVVEKLRLVSPDENLPLDVRRGEETVKLEVQLGRLPEALPDALPAAHPEPEAPAGQRPQVGVSSMKLPEFENECVLYVPDDYHPQVAHGVVVWLHAPGGFDQNELIERWRPYCEQYDLILVAPKSADSTRWQPSEAKFVRRTIDEVLKTYEVDRSRIVVHGYQGGGALAYLVAFANLDIVRAVAVVEAALPIGMQVPETDPVRRLAVYTTTTSRGNLAPQIEAGIQQLRELKYPVTAQNLGEQGRYLIADEFDALIRWIDSLDRL